MQLWSCHFGTSIRGWKCQNFWYILIPSSLSTLLMYIDAISRCSCLPDIIGRCGHYYSWNQNLALIPGIWHLVPDCWMLTTRYCITHRPLYRNGNYRIRWKFCGVLIFVIFVLTLNPRNLSSILTPFYAPFWIIRPRLTRIFALANFNLLS